MTWKLYDRGIKKHPICDFCNEISWDSYMVTDAVWLSASLRRNQHAHLSCLQQILKREFKIDDFTDARANELVRIGYRMKKD